MTPLAGRFLRQTGTVTGLPTADGKVSSIFYGDGTSVEMEYTALRQLALVKDWLVETRIERDAAGNPTDITDHKGRTVSYEWGSMGERRSITYPDGKKVCYFYDDQMRLKKMRMEKSGNRYEYKEISYAYDTMGRIAEKRFPEGMRTLWHYDDRGQLSELLYEDERGILNRLESTEERQPEHMPEGEGNCMEDGIQGKWKGLGYRIRMMDRGRATFRVYGVPI